MDYSESQCLIQVLTVGTRLDENGRGVPKLGADYCMILQLVVTPTQHRILHHCQFIALCVFMPLLLRVDVDIFACQILKSVGSL